MDLDKKTERLKARKTALENAGAFIESHGDEGGVDQDDFKDFDIDIYLKECKKVAKTLYNNKAFKLGKTIEL